MKTWISLLSLLAATACAGEVYTSRTGVALRGTDPVAYFTLGKPTEGKSQFEHRWNGATWRFASARHRDLFAASPQKYAPQYGGFCAYGVAGGYKVKTEPDAWKIVGGKLYLNYDRKVQKLWEKDIPGYIRTADRNWPRLRGE